MDDNCLSPGGIVALVALSDTPQDVEITVQIKEELSRWNHFTVSDGTHWVPAIVTPYLSCPGGAKPLQIMQITKACYHRKSGSIFVDGATVVQDLTPACMIGDPEELVLEVGPHKYFPIARLRLGMEESPSYPPIRALVTYKSRLDEEIHHWGQPPFFIIHLLDETGEIRAHTNDGIARELYDHFEEGKVYYIHNASVASSNWCLLYNLTHHYKLILTRETLIEECHEITDIPVLKFDFTPLDQIPQAGRGTICDVIGVVSYVGPLQVTNNRKTDEKLFKRIIFIADQSVHGAFAFLWANRAEEFDVPKGTVVAFRRVKVYDDSGQRLSVLSTSTVHIEPQIEEAVAIHRWYELASKHLGSGGPP